MRSLLLAMLATVGCGDVEKLTTDSKTPACGDSVVDTGEECDTGAESAGCNDDCTRAVCGDSKVNATAGETCDDGDAKDDNGCSNVCQPSGGGVYASTGKDGAFAPTADTTLDAGVHNYTTINIPAGVTVTVNGNGELDLRATGDIVIDGTIDVSGGAGGAGGDVAGAGGCYIGAGGGGSTGTRIDGASIMPTLCGPGGAGGSGLTGANGSGSCTAQGGFAGGGAGGGVCAGGGGGGGYAGGGGGSSYTTSYPGGNGASAYGGIGGAGALAGQPAPYTANAPGGGAKGTGVYAGAAGTYTNAACTSFPGTPGGGGAIGFVAEADLAVATTFQPGSGGGGGGGQCNSCDHGSGGGGGGGGAVRIASATSLKVGAAGKVLANGGNGGLANSLVGITGITGGGGGSGGVIYISAPSLDVAAGAVVSAIGGVGGTSFPTSCGKGGDGGMGRIRVSGSGVASTCSLNGTFIPMLVSGCAPANMPGMTFVAVYPN